jgi:hypothetical protein
MQVRIWIYALILSLPVAATLTATLADTKDKIRQKNGQITQLGMRLAPLTQRQAGPPYEATYWSEARAIIEASDAAKDASADIAAGHTGFMTHANNAIAESPIAPGVKCFDRSETSRRAVFLFAYKPTLREEAGQALLAFDVYARLYNGHIFQSGRLSETSCKAVVW